MSLSDFLEVSNAVVIVVLSFLSPVLGLCFSVKALESIECRSDGLLGKDCAVTAAVISASWLILILAGVVMPALFYVNS